MENGSQHAIGRALRVIDISGIPVEFFYKMDTVKRALQRFDLYRGANMQRIDHFNCMVPDVQKAYDFYINELDYRVSEYTTTRSEEHTSELQSRFDLVCRLLLEKKKRKYILT